MVDRLNIVWYIYSMESYKDIKQIKRDEEALLCTDMEQAQGVLLSGKKYVVLCKVYQQLNKKGKNLCVCLDRYQILGLFWVNG